MAKLTDKNTILEIYLETYGQEYYLLDSIDKRNGQLYLFKKQGNGQNN